MLIQTGTGHTDVKADRYSGSNVVNTWSYKNVNRDMNRQVRLVRTMLSIQRCTLHWGAMSSCRWTRGSPLRVSRNPVEKRPSGVIIRNTTLLLIQFYSSQPTQIMHVCSQWTQRNTQLNNREHRQGDLAPTRVSLSLDHEAVLTSWSGYFSTRHTIDEHAKQSLFGCGPAFQASLTK